MYPAIVVKRDLEEETKASSTFSQNSVWRNVVNEDTMANTITAYGVGRKNVSHQSHWAANNYIKLYGTENVIFFFKFEGKHKVQLDMRLWLSMVTTSQSLSLILNVSFTLNFMNVDVDRILKGGQ